MFEMNLPALFGEDNKMLLWVGLGLMVVAIAVYVFMTRTTAEPASTKECHPEDSACLLHPTEQMPTQITCIVNESGEQVCDDQQQTNL